MADDKKRALRIGLTVVVGLMATVVAVYVYREKFPSDERILARFKSELRGDSTGWESAELYHSKHKASNTEYKALHAIYRQDGAVFWFGASLQIRPPMNITVSISSVPPSEATTMDGGGTLAIFLIPSNGQVEKEHYYGLAALSKEVQALLRRKALEFRHAAAIATGS